MDRRAKTAIDRVLQAEAALLLGSMLLAALHDVSRAWDVWYYHLPFAARLAGVVSPESFVFTAANQERFSGLPLFGELLQGTLWRLTGRAEAATLVSFACVPLLAWWLRRRFGVPLHLSVLGLFAIPLVQTHATSCYVDLPANTAASVLVLLAIEAHASLRPVDERTLGIAGLAALVAVNTKVLVQPLVLVALVALGWRALPPLVRALGTPARARALRTLVVVLLALPVIFVTPLKNAILHHNPYFPVRMSVLGHEFPGAEDPYGSSPPWLAGRSEPVRFAASLLEIGVRPMTDPRRWTVDQWMPSDSTGPRMGGFFGAYVVVAVVLLGWRVARERSRVARVAGAGFLLLTGITGIMPQAHELRYYLVWMIVLVALNLWLASREGAAPVGPGPRSVGLVAAVALVLVIVVTRGAYVYPSGTTFAELVREKVDEPTLSTVRDGERVCVRREPYNLLWAAPFHPPRRYVVKSAEDPEDCAGYRPLD